MDQQHEDVVALNQALTAMRMFVDEQTARDIVTMIQNEGIVFRMAQWWVENHQNAPVR